MSTFVNGKGGGITDPQAFVLALGIDPKFNSIQDLRDFAVTDLPSGTEASISYHTNYLDRGAGVFLWQPLSEKEDTDGTVVKPTGRTAPGRWVRRENVLNDGFVDIRWFGAIPSVTDFDNSIPINKAIQALPLYYNTTLVVNGGYMRSGACYVPSGVWYVQKTIVCTGGMRLIGEGPNASFIQLKPNSTGFTSATPKTLTSAVMAGAGLMHLTLSAPHGVPVGHLTSGWVEGVSGTYSNLLNIWHRMKAVSETVLEIQFGGTGTYTVSSGTVDMDAWVVDFQTDLYNISMNNTFGTVIENISIMCGAVAGGNAGSSGLYVAGAQLSYANHVRVADAGKIGTVCDVSADNFWAANSIKGPGFMQTLGPAFNNGMVNSEHHNQNALYDMPLISGGRVPRPAFYLRGSSTAGTRFQQAQGEDSPMEFVIDGATRIVVDLFNINGPGAVTRNGWPTTLLYLAGDSYGHSFGKVTLQGVFTNIVNDQSTLAINAGENGVKPDFDTIAKRVGGGSGILIRDTPLLTSAYPAYANDAAAATAGVQIGMAYKVTGGGIAWRQADDSGPPSAVTITDGTASAVVGGTTYYWPVFETDPSA